MPCLQVKKAKVMRYCTSFFIRMADWDGWGAVLSFYEWIGSYTDHILFPF